MILNKIKTSASAVVIVSAVFWVIAVSACNTDEDKFSSPDHYDLESPFEIKLPMELDEISGVAFYSKDTSIFAIHDERGWLYKISVAREPQISKWKFFDGGDFEDVVLLDSTFYVLESTGNIVAFRHYTADSVLAKKNIFPDQRGNEFEILYWDEEIQKLVLMCKDCGSDKKHYLSTFVFDPITEKFSSHDLTIDVTSIAMLVNEEKLKFKPSAAAIHPLTGELYIFSAVNDLLVITGRKGTAKATAVYAIDPANFKQPEGISFTPSGDMIVSNEAADIGVANIMIFKYSKNNLEHK